MSGLSARSVPAPGQAPLVAPNAAALLRRNAHEFGDRIAIKFGDAVVDPRRVLRGVVPVRGAVPRAPAGRRAPARRGAARQHARLPLRVRRRRADRRGDRRSQPHPPRRASPARRLHTHCGLGAHRTSARGVARADRRSAPADPLVGSVRGARRSGVDARRVAGRRARRARRREGSGIEPDIDSIWALIFTSGTSDAPKAVICSQRRLLVTGKRMSMIMDIGPDDVGYVCMPLFHSNAVQVGWAPSLVTPCAVGLGRRFSASRWLRDVRRYGATYFNYTGKPLAYLLAQPETPTTPTTRLRVAFGNEGSPEVVDTFSRRFGVEVIDAYGATEGGVAVNRDVDMPPVRSASRPSTCRSSTTTARRSRGRARRAGACSTPRRAWARSSTPRASGRSRATTTTTTRPRRPPASAGTGRATSATRTSDGFLYFAGPQRRLDPRRRRELSGRPDRGERCARRRASCSPPSTAFPTTKPATR